MRLAVVASGLVLLLGGCGSDPTVVSGTSPAGITPYDGPLSLPVDHADDASVLARSGAAGRALECSGKAYDGGGGDYDSGLESAQGSPEAALENYFHEEGWAATWGMPSHGYRIERRDDHRVLFSYDVDGRTRAAVVVADSVEDWKHHTGWGVEGWARCDPAEFPAAFTDGLALAVWTDATGARVPVTTVTSWQGPEHCDWQDITFLEIGSEANGRGKEEYLRDTTGELGRWLDGSYDAHATLPTDATDTGWRHDGRGLWKVPDRSAAYLVDLADPTDVERWPASTEPIGCD
jgi:hypothetical protein